MDALIQFAGRLYRASLAKSLNKYGLRYEDIIIADHPDVKRALKYIPKDELLARNRRIKRAHHLSMIHEYLPEEIQKQQTPFKFYLNDKMEEMQKLREERERLNNF